MKRMQRSQIIYIYMYIQREEETEVELVDLGLPLQGPGWTEYACVRGYVGVQVKREGDVIGTEPRWMDQKEQLGMFLDASSISGLLSTA